VVRRAAVKLFQMTGPATAKLLVPSVVLVLGTQCEQTITVVEIARQSSTKYIGANPCRHLNCHSQHVLGSLVDWKPVNMTKHLSDVDKTEMRCCGHFVYSLCTPYYFD